MDNERTLQNDKSNITTAEVLYWLEFACWTTLLLAPFLRWVNGAAVSTDQFVVRTAVVSLALLGGVVLRTYKWLARTTSPTKK